ncbi:hypothetical protein C1750_09195 [Stenotrophomonas pavanii]|nr:hypothetical protein ABB31_14050 [Stenotrophomonas pavanii]PNY73291.1 hypothetical protein C1750_09195 [Stenotrophomonas pavanii]
MSLESIFELLCVLAVVMLVIAIASRFILVWELKRNSPELWISLGKPAILERDHLMRKYPFCGWWRVFRVASGDRKLLLAVFWLSFSTYLVVLIPLVWIWIIR